MYDEYPYVEPCCYHKHLTQITDVVRRRGYANFFTHTDVPLRSVLEWLATDMPMSEMTVSLLAVDRKTVEILGSLLSHEYYEASTGIQGFSVQRLNIISQGNDRQLLSSLRDRFPGRVRLAADPKLAFRCITMKRDERAYVIQGTVYQSTGSGCLQMFSMMSGTGIYNETHRILDSLLKIKGY